MNAERSQKAREQIGHWYGRSLVCVLWWVVKCEFDANIFEQTSHSYVFECRWYFSCLSNASAVSCSFPHVRQRNSNSIVCKSADRLTGCLTSFRSSLSSKMSSVTSFTLIFDKSETAGDSFWELVEKSYLIGNDWELEEMNWVEPFFFLEPEKNYHIKA